jgi:redox-sensitive bicupin YhaK (pirin superfamily)
MPDLDTARAEPSAPALEISESRIAHVGTLEVRRALPRRTRRTVGAWCFLDHAGPLQISSPSDVGIGPHPHIGLQTVTWLLAGELLHRDSLGSEQVIRPGQLNLMTAGRGVVHAEEGTGDASSFHAVQLWVAQPSATRDGASGFEHHAELPRDDFGAATTTVLVGSLAGLTSTARRDTDHMGADLDVRGAATLPLRSDYEHALVVTAGAVTVDGGEAIEPGHLAYLGRGRDELNLSSPSSGGARALLLGGVPFEEPILMWWNYVARTREEISAAHRDWTARADRFGAVQSSLASVDVAPPPWETS